MAESVSLQKLKIASRVREVELLVAVTHLFDQLVQLAQRPGVEARRVLASVPTPIRPPGV